MIRLGLSEFALIALLCLAAWVIARAVLATAIALPCLRNAAVCAIGF